MERHMAQALDNWLTTPPEEKYNMTLSEEYDHDFEPEEICLTCGESDENCECDADDKDMGNGDYCVICQEEEDAPIHTMTDEEE